MDIKIEGAALYQVWQTNLSQVNSVVWYQEEPEMLWADAGGPLLTIHFVMLLCLVCFFIIWHGCFKQMSNLELLLEYSLAYLITFILVIAFGKV